MHEYEYIVLDVFTDTPFEGNPLAVLPEADGLTETQMQKIAAEFNLSETVFLRSPANGTAAAAARIFTPRRELAFAGHPTIGAAAVLNARGNLGPSFIIEEPVGPVALERTGDRFWLTTPPITFYETLDAAFASRLLGLDSADIEPNAVPEFVSAGSPQLVVCLQSTQAVDRAQLQHEFLPQALGSVNAVGTFLFARKEPQSKTNFDVHSRMFGPQSGIAEDPATGAATGPLAAYMMRYGLLPNDRPTAFVSEQGVKMGRRSLLHVRTDPRDSSIKVGGEAVVVASGTLRF